MRTEHPGASVHGKVEAKQSVPETGNLMERRRRQSPDGALEPQEAAHHTHTNPVTSHPTQRQAPLTINYNHVDSYTRVLLYVAHTNLML